MSATEISGRPTVEDGETLPASGRGFEEVIMHPSLEQTLMAILCISPLLREGNFEIEFQSLNG